MIKINKKKIKINNLRISLLGWLFLSCPVLVGADELKSAELPSELPSLGSALKSDSSLHHIHFTDVPVIEFIRFVSKISHVNFIFDNQDLQFNITFSTGKSVSSSDVLKSLVQMLQIRGFGVVENEHNFIIHRFDEDSQTGENKLSSDKLVASLDSLFLKRPVNSNQFFVYKLQYHQGAEILEAVKNIAADLRNKPDTSPKLLNAIQSLQWVKTTNSLLCSADDATLESLKSLIEKLDAPSRQVFIEVLVVETDIRKGLDFGLEWAAGGQYRSKVGFGMGNFPAGFKNMGPGPLNGGSSPFAGVMQGINAVNTPTGLNQFPIGSGFDLGVIGDIIMHKGRSFLSLGSLVSALQIDGDSTIVLNQKIITQDNKNSTIFVGDNIPFTGSVVQTVGQSQQTTANIEYRDIGVSLSITPMLGEGDIITLDINEEITESLDHTQTSNTTVNGIRTTKTNMVTHVHVPDKHFLVLSGMIRNAKARHKTGIPCLGGLPVIGAAFSKTSQHDEKRNVIIFVRPSIIHSFEDYNHITGMQEETFRNQSQPGEFDRALKILPSLEDKQIEE